MMKKEDRMNKPAETAADEKSAHIIAGRNAVFEAVKAGTRHRLSLCGARQSKRFHRAHSRKSA